MAESDKIGAFVKDHRSAPPQVLRALTIYHALGVPLDSKVAARPDHDGRADTRVVQ